MGSEFFRGTHHIGRNRLPDRRQFLQASTEHPAAANLLLGRIRFIQLQAGCTRQLTGGLFYNHAEVFAQRPWISFGKVHGGLDANGVQVRFHSPSDAPYLPHSRVAQHPITLNRVGDVHHSAGLGLQALGGVVGQLGQGFGRGDAYADWDPRAAQYLRADLPTEGVQIHDSA
ncbi:hypothetical protein D3C72_1510940 [compost metagenome]